jgi:hypothetical protein
MNYIGNRQAAGIVCFLLAVAAVSSCASVQRTGSVPAQTAPTGLSLTPVTTALPIIASDHDSLVPAALSTAPKLGLNAAVAALKSDPATADFFADLSHATARLGLYTNPNVQLAGGMPISAILSYVFTGVGTCPPSAGPPGTTGAPTPPAGLCTTTVVDNASDGTQEVQTVDGIG